jgi:general secretion pathway protein K
MKDRGSQPGFALLIVLFALALLALLVGTIGVTGRGEAQLAGNLRAAAQAEAAADGAIEQAAFHVLDSAAGHWWADGTVHRLTLTGGGVAAVRIDSEAGKVNPNRASAGLLAALMQAVGIDSLTAATIAANILDWRTPDAQGAASGQAPAYRQAGRDYIPPAAPFQSLDEVGMVLGMTPALLGQLRPHLSLYRDRDPDPLAADKVVAQAIATVTGQAVTPGFSTDESVVRITAAAETPGGARFIRQAVLRIDPRAQGGRPFQVMTWITLPTDDTAAPAP